MTAVEQIENAESERVTATHSLGQIDYCCLVDWKDGESVRLVANWKSVFSY